MRGGTGTLKARVCPGCGQPMGIYGSAGGDGSHFCPRPKTQSEMATRG